MLACFKSSLVNAVEFIRIYYECVGRIEKSVPRITLWHHEACRVMINSDGEGVVFLSHPHTNKRFFFLLNIKYHILIFKKRLPEVPEYDVMRHNMIMTL